MPARKARLPVVLDTNVIVSYYLGKKPLSASARIFRLWRYERKLQLIVSDEVTAEYFELLERVGIAERRVARFRQQLREGSIVTHVNLGARYVISRDPDDDVLLTDGGGGASALPDHQRPRSARHSTGPKTALPVRDRDAGRVFDAMGTVKVRPERRAMAVGVMNSIGWRARRRARRMRLAWPRPSSG